MKTLTLKIYLCEDTVKNVKYNYSWDTNFKIRKIRNNKDAYKIVYKYNDSLELKMLNESINRR